MLYKIFEALSKKAYPSKELDMYAHPNEVAAHEKNELNNSLKRYTFVEGNYYGFFIGVVVGAALCALLFICL